MILNSINILNYKNIAEAQLQFAPKVNCLIGNNGMGKTNILDAIYYLSFCRSFSTLIDAAVINHDAPFAMIQGNYLRNEAEEQISISIQRGKRKVAKRNGKEYKRLSQHIGLLPIVMISPMDWDLIRGAGEERRKLMDVIISQGNPVYLDALIRYGKALEQRNSMIKHEFRDPLLYETVELQLCEAAAVIHKAREQWIREFEPIFMHYYQAIAGSAEQVNLSYSSHLNDATMEQHLNATRERDMLIGHTTRGVHRDDIVLMLNGYNMRQVGSQGQCKTYTIALRLAQFDFIKQNNATTPILLLDDIFDKLDAQRVESIVGVVSREQFGQIFITDTNRTHLDEIIAHIGGDNAMFQVNHGVCTPVERRTDA